MLQDWQQRVIEEQEQLVIKINKLALYLNGEPKNPLLWVQLQCMKTYREILSARIEEFTDDR